MIDEMSLEYAVSSLAALSPLIAIISAFTIPLIYTWFKSRKLVFAISETVLVVNALITLTVFNYVFSTNRIIYYMFAGFPPPLGIAYEVDVLGAFMGVLIGLIFPFINIFSYKYLEEYSGIEWYYTLYLGLEAGLLGIAYTGDIFNLFVMLEVASIAAYALVAFKRHLGYSLEASIKYAIVGSIASTIYFIAVVLAYSGLGTLSMADIAAHTIGTNTLFNLTYGYTTNVGVTLTLLLGLTVWAFMIEAALVPHHFWLPDAYSAAPATVAATLSAVAEGVAVYVILRYVHTIIGVEQSLWVLPLFLILGSLAAIFGGFMITVQNELKRLIAYSTVMDVGFMFIGLGLNTPTAITATLYYVMSHAIVKPLLFLTAGMIEKTYGTTKLEELRGMLRSTPILALGLFIGGLAVGGIPPTNLFVAKLSLIISVLEKEYYPLIIVIVLSSALALIGFMRAFYATYFAVSKTIKSPQTTFSILNTLILVFAILVLLTGILYPYISSNIISPISEYLFNPNNRIEYVRIAEEYLKLIFQG